jgi:hypothetical protein
MLTALCLALAAALAPNSAGEKLAAIDLIAPQAQSFVLHATIPLPPGEWAPGASPVPFGIISHDPERRVVPAQVEGVSRYPDGSWDVVQLLARVERGADELVGEPLRFDVVRAPHPRGLAHAPNKLLQGLLEEPGSIFLRCRDVYGHAYTFSLFALPKGPGTPRWSMRKDGRFLNQFRTAGVMLPRADEYTERRAGPPLAHMFGILAWFSDWQGEQSLQLDLRVHNGLSSGAAAAALGEEPVGAIYWQSLELVLPRGLNILPLVADPFFGEAYDEGERRVFPLVSPYDDGELHMLPPQAQFLRRLVIVNAGDESLARARLDRAGLGFCAHDTALWSWANPLTARYFPQRDELPSMGFYSWKGRHGKGALRTHEIHKLQRLREQLESGAEGTYPTASPAMGWAQPYFVSFEGGAGGEEIALLEGQRAVGGASGPVLQRLELTHRMNVCRQPQALWDAGGQVVGVFRWRRPESQEKALAVDFRPYGWGVLPEFKLPCRGGPPANAQVHEVARRGARPLYDGGTPFQAGGAPPRGDQFIINWQPHDAEHWVRYTKNAKALLWLADDPSAEDDLELCAELFRLYFHEFQAPTDGKLRVTLAQFEERAREQPGEGLYIGRGHAWGIDAFCAYYSTAPDPWRERHRPWAERVSDLLVAGAMPSGVVIRSDYEPLLHNPRYEGAHAFQSQLLLLAQRSLIESVLGGVDGSRTGQLKELYLRTVQYLFWGPVWQRVKTDWSQGDAPVFDTGPRWAFAVARNDGDSLPPFSDTSYWGQGYLPDDACYGGVETSYGYATLASAADWTQATDGAGLKNRYMLRSLDYGRSPASFDELYKRLTGRAADLVHDGSKDSAGFISRLQRWRHLGR